MLLSKFRFIELINELNIFLTAVIFSDNTSAWLLFIYPNRSQRITCVSNSDAEPDAMYKKCTVSWFVPRPYHSAMLREIEVTARLIWDTIAKSSSRGNYRVRMYISSASSMASFHTF